MVLSVWRYAHLALALISSVFLIILSLTGVILAVNAIYEKIPDIKVENFEELSLSEVIPNLQKTYSEVISLTVDHRGFVSVDAIDKQGESIKGYIDPNTGKIIGAIKLQSPFIQWTTALHRSLFLKETGRIIVALVTFLLVLISVSGIALVIKRQNNWKNFFKKIQKDSFSQYFHVLTGRWALIPVLIIAISGTLLYLLRLSTFQGEEQTISINNEESISQELIPTEAFIIFQSTLLNQVEQIDFPFIPEDPEEHFVIKLKDKAITVSQISGEVIDETIYPKSKTWEVWNLDIHTGRTNIIWAIILGIASINILFFIYTGFAITLRRSRTKIKNKFKASQATTIILFGSENGSTMFFANKIHLQLLAAGEKSYLAGLNEYKTFESAKRLIIFSSTYGLGDPPSNAKTFSDLLTKHPQPKGIAFSILGFGSKAYSDFCAFATHLDQLLNQQEWATQFLPVYFVNDRSIDDLLKWINAYSEKSQIGIATAPSIYSQQQPKLESWKVIEKTNISANNETFKVVLRPLKQTKFSSGDLLAIYPADDHRERLYSIGKCNDNIQLIVKIHPQGLGSTFLHNLKPGETINARRIINDSFKIPKKAKSVALIFNGTGIAPFLGMVDENNRNISMSLFGGFRKNNQWVQEYSKYFQEKVNQKKLQNFQFSFSREENKQYVMDLIKDHHKYFIDLLESNGTIMICGSLAMLRDVEKILEEIIAQKNDKTLSFYKERNQILHDCY